MNKDWYYLDPDNNKDDPGYLHCSRCKMPITDMRKGDSFFAIVIHPENPWYRLAAPTEKGNGMIGMHCHKKMVKEYGVVGSGVY